MTGVESIVRRLFEGRSRRWSIITVNAVLALALGLPAADEYFAQRQREVELSAQLEQAEEQVQRSDELQSRVTQVAAQLGNLEDRALLEKDAQDYRQAIVQLIRQSGCQLRKLNLDNPKTRDWGPEDHPLTRPKQSKNKQKEKSSGYQLRTQAVTLSISGALQDVRAFLSELQADDKMMHVSHLSIRPNGRNRDSVVMELQFQLFGLEKTTTASPAA